MPEDRELHVHNATLERAIVYAFHLWPILHEEDVGLFPRDAFYLERYRVMYLAQAKQYQATGAYAPGTIVERLRAEGQHEIALDYFRLACSTDVEDGIWPPCQVELAVDALMLYYQRRERAKAVAEYEARCLSGGEESEARLLLDMHLSAIDTMRGQTDTPDEEIADMLGEGATRPTGFEEIDTFTGGLAYPGLNIVAALASVGKSALARGIIRQRAKLGDRVYWYSQDQSLSQIYALEYARLTGKPPGTLRSMTSEARLAVVQRIRSESWRDRVTLLDRPTPLATLLGIIRSARPDLVVIDYLQLIDAGFEKEYDNVTATSKALKTLAFQLRVPVLALAQFNRAAARGDRVSLADLRASGQIEQDADVVMALSRDTTLRSTEPQEAKLTVLKNKVGPTGSVGLVWIPHRASFEQRASRAVEGQATAWYEKN